MDKLTAIQNTFEPTTSRTFRHRNIGMFIGETRVAPPQGNYRSWRTVAHAEDALKRHIDRVVTRYGSNQEVALQASLGSTHVKQVGFYANEIFLGTSKEAVRSLFEGLVTIKPIKDEVQLIIDDVLELKPEDQERVRAALNETM